MTIIDNDILGTFQIDVYPEQYVLREVKSIDTSHRLSKGEEGEKEVTHGYFVNLGHLVTKLIQIKLSREENTVTLQEFWQAWIGYSKKFTSLLDNDIYQWKQEIDKQLKQLNEKILENNSVDS